MQVWWCCGSTSIRRWRRVVAAVSPTRRRSLPARAHLSTPTRSTSPTPTGERSTSTASRPSTRGPVSKAFQFAIRIYSIRHAMSNRFVLFKKSAFRFTSCHAVWTKTNSYAMHTIKLLLTYYLNISVQAANLSDCRIESSRKNRLSSENRI